MAFVNNMQCEYDMLMYVVLTWVVHGGELYVSIIIIHGMLMLHVNIYMHA